MLGFLEYDLKWALNKAQRRATGLVYLAIKSGKLPPARTQRCKDCGKAATEYDHRDYSQPLKVEAVCRSCNVKRGPGIKAQ